MAFQGVDQQIEGNTPRSNVRGGKWEYLTLHIDLPELQRQVDETRGMVAGLNDLGAEGWFLFAVSAVDIKLQVRHFLWFRRPVANE